MPGEDLDLAAQLADARAVEAGLRPVVTPDAATGAISGTHRDVEQMIEVNARIRSLQTAMGLELDPRYDGEAVPLEAEGRDLFGGTAPDADRLRAESLLHGLRHSFSEPEPEPAPPPTAVTPVPAPEPAPEELPVWKRPAVLIGVAAVVLVIGAAFSLLGGDDDGEPTSAAPDGTPSSAAAPTTTTTSTAAAPTAATPVAPAATLESVLSPPSTLYTIQIGDDVDAYDYDWSETDISCGAFVVGSGGRAQWDHPTADGGCTHVAPDHPGTIVVRATRGDGATYTCTYTGGSTAGSVACVGG